MLARAIAGLAVMGLLGGCGLFDSPVHRPEIDLRAGVPHTTTINAVEALALAQIAAMAPTDPTNVVPAEVVKITLLRVGQRYPVAGDLEWSDSEVAWAVEWRGTVRSCGVMGPDCDIFTAGTFFIRDGAGIISANYANP